MKERYALAEQNPFPPKEKKTEQIFLSSDSKKMNKMNGGEKEGAEDSSALRYGETSVEEGTCVEILYILFLV